MPDLNSSHLSLHPVFPKRRCWRISAAFSQRGGDMWIVAGPSGEVKGVNRIKRACWKWLTGNCACICVARSNIKRFSSITMLPRLDTCGTPQSKPPMVRGGQLRRPESYIDRRAFHSRVIHFSYHVEIYGRYRPDCWLFGLRIHPV